MISFVQCSGIREGQGIGVKSYHADPDAFI